MQHSWNITAIEFSSNLRPLGSEKQNWTAAWMGQKENEGHAYRCISDSVLWICPCWCLQRISQAKKHWAEMHQNHFLSCQFQSNWQWEQGGQPGLKLASFSELFTFKHKCMRTLGIFWVDLLLLPSLAFYVLAGQSPEARSFGDSAFFINHPNPPERDIKKGSQCTYMWKLRSQEHSSYQLSSFIAQTISRDSRNNTMPWVPSFLQ